jgi:predicted esterase
VIFIAFLAIFVTPLSSFAQIPSNPPIVCIGPESAKNHAIYLHGMDTASPSSHELKIRDRLGQLAQDLDMRIAVPRSQNICPKNQDQLCWSQKSSDDVRRTIASQVIASEMCFGSKKPDGIVGFSNGGYLLGKAAVNDCDISPFKFVVAIGSAGSVRGESAKRQPSCTPFTLMIGKKDKLTYNSAVAFATQLKNFRANSYLVEYVGGHDVPDFELKEVLTKHFQRGSQPEVKPSK